MPAGRRRGEAADLPLRRRHADELHARRQGRALQLRAARRARPTCSSPPAPSPSSTASTSPAACRCRCSAPRPSTPSGTRPASGSPTPTRRATRWSGASTTTRPSPATSGSGTRRQPPHAASPPPASTTASRCGRPASARSTTSPRRAAASTSGGSTSPTRSTRSRSRRTPSTRCASSSISAAGDLCYTFDGEIWVRPAGAAESRKLDVTAAADRRDLRRRAGSTSRARSTSSTLSPNGKEVAFVARGEVFVASVEHGTTRRITDTPGPGALGELLARRQEPPLRRRARRELEPLPHRPHRPRGARLLQRHGAQGEPRSSPRRPRSSSRASRRTARRSPTSRSAPRSRC